MTNPLSDLPSLQRRQHILKLVSRIAGVQVNELKPDVLIREELGIDSLKALEIVARIEKDLSILINEGQLLSVRTVEHFINLIERNYTDQ